MNDPIQKLELVDERWDALINGKKLDTIRFEEMHIEPGFMIYRNCSNLETHCIVHVAKVMDIPLRDVLKYTRDRDRKPNEAALLERMKVHYPVIELDTRIQYIQHLSPSETLSVFPDEVKEIERLL